LDHLYSHRMLFIDKYNSIKEPQVPAFQDSLPTQKELSSFLNGQLSLFPAHSGFTNLKWNRDKIEFIELFISIHESKAVVGANDKPVTKKDYMALLMWFFNIQIAHWHGSWSYGKDRKVKRESEYLKELVATYNRIVNKGI
jgi:hypothetical protein